MGKSLFCRMKPSVKQNYNDTIIRYPQHAKEIKEALEATLFINDIPLGIAFNFCAFVMDVVLDYNVICESFEPLT